MKKQFSYTLFLVGCLVVLFSLSACQKKDTSVVQEQPIEDKQFLLGTYVSIKIFDKGKEEALKEAFHLIKALGDKITVNEKGSQIDKINENAGIKPIQVSDDIYSLLKKAYTYSASSKGSFDMTIGPITSLWRIGFPDARKPDEQEIKEALQKVDYKKVELNDTKKTAYLTEKGMKLDLGSIAKGFITDKVVSLLKEKKVTTAIIDLGGNVYVLGNSVRSTKEKTYPWTVGIQDPNQARNVVLGQIPERNRSIVTSGIYERFLQVDGKTYHHLFNPKTGYPFDNNLEGVTIVSKRSVDGDGLSTTLFSLGLKEGMKYIHTLKDTEAIFVTKEKALFVTNGLKDVFTLNPKAGYHLEN